MEENEEFREWWVSCPVFTVWVKTIGTRIVDAAPIVKRWIGQNFFRFVSYYSAEIVRIK
jgi:hypothetical protein